MKIPSVRLTLHTLDCKCIGEVLSMDPPPTECRPGRWYDEKTARLMERAVKLLVNWSAGNIDAWKAVESRKRIADQWAKMTEKKMGN